MTNAESDLLFDHTRHCPEIYERSNIRCTIAPVGLKLH